jgi:acyl carrier protein
VVPAAGHDVTSADLRKYALERMAPHKAPRRIALVARIPTREPGTKPRRKDLADLLGFTEAVPSPDRPVSTGTELSLSAIWCQVLKLREVGPDEDFFFLGGDSISGAQILTMVDEVFGVALEPFSMYDDANTVRGMAELVTAARGKAAGGELDAVTG